MIEAAHMYFLLLSAGASVSHEHISFVTVMFLFRVSCNMVVRFHGLCPKVLITFFFIVFELRGCHSPIFGEGFRPKQN